MKYRKLSFKIKLSTANIDYALPSTTWERVKYISMYSYSCYTKLLEQAKNSIKALKQIAGYAEKKKIVINLEFLNSSVNHKDYMADTTKWNVALVKGVGSENVKVLYDIYHAASMKEDVISDIKKHHECWGHYHTAGVPGRKDLDDEQTLDYKAIMNAIVDTGYTGIVAHEFGPKGDPFEALKHAYNVCDV